MSNTTGYITDYDAIGTIDRTADVLEIVDVSANTSFKVTVNNLVGISGGNVVSTTDTQTVQNKTLDVTNTITVFDNLFTIQDGGDATKQVVFQASGITTSTIRTLTIPDASGTVVLTGATQTLTGKTLTSPTITGGTMDNSTVTVDAIAGHTTSNTGTVYGVAVTTGTIGTAGLANASVTANKLSTGAQTAVVATSQTTTSPTFTDLGTVGPAVTVTIGANGLALVILSGKVSNGTAGDYGVMGFVVSGANTIAASFTNSLAIQGGSTSNELASSYSILLTGLSTGSTTFTCKYEIITGGTGTFRDRNITVIPL